MPVNLQAGQICRHQHFGARAIRKLQIFRASYISGQRESRLKFNAMLRLGHQRGADYTLCASSVSMRVDGLMASGSTNGLAEFALRSSRCWPAVDDRRDEIFSRCLSSAMCLGRAVQCDQSCARSALRQRQITWRPESLSLDLGL
jgi:hypothetical protein